MTSKRAPEFVQVYRNDGPPEMILEAAEVTTAAGERYLHHRLRASGGRVGAVVIAISDSDMLFVEVDRPSVGRSLLELPRGFGERSDGDGVESDVEAYVRGGLRELLEETGLHAENAEILGSYMVDSAVYPQDVAVVGCTIPTRVSAGQPDGEVIGVVWVPVQEVSAQIVRGVLRDGHTLSALAIWMSAQRHQSEESR